MNGTVESFFVNYNYYDSYQGDGQKSGAYIFRPSNDTSKKYSTIIHSLSLSTEVVVLVLEGGKTYSILYRSKMEGYADAKEFKINTKVDSIPIADKIDK